VAEEKEEPKKEVKTEKKSEKSPVEKKPQAIFSRHKNLPTELVTSLKESKNAMECKRKLKEYLQKQVS